MTLREVFGLVLAAGQVEAVACYVVGRVNSRRALRRANDAGYDEGREDGYADALDDLHAWPPRDNTSSGQAYGRAAAGSAEGEAPTAARPLDADERERAGPWAPDWREQMAADLAPDVLAADDVPRPGRDVAAGPVPEHWPGGSEDRAGPGHSAESWPGPAAAGTTGATGPGPRGGGFRPGEQGCTGDVRSAAATRPEPDDLADELGAEIEAHLARRFETAAEWEARMDYEHALFCDRNELVNEWQEAAR